MSSSHPAGSRSAGSRPAGSRSASSLVAGSGLLALVAAATGEPLLSGMAALGAVLLLNFVNMAAVIGSPLVRRAVRQLPYLAPLVSYGLPAVQSPPWWAWLLCIGPVLAWHGVRYRDIAITVRAARLFPPVGVEERAAGMLPAALSGATQEYLHRGVLLGALAPVIGPAAVAAVAATFVAEHVLTSNPAVRRSARDIALWTGLSLLFGSAVLVHPGALWAAMVGHTLFNLPEVVQWARIPGRRGVAAGAGR